MQYTTHYNLNLPEGSDIVNPLVQDNPNYVAIDAALYANKLRTTGDATHTKSGTAHTITRADSDIPALKFVATGDYDIGDTFTVDGITVTPRLANGKTMANKAFVINSTVVCILDGTILNILNVYSVVSASDVILSNNETVEETLIRGSVSVTADGIKTYTTLLNELNALIDHSKVTYNTVLYADGHLFRIVTLGSTLYFDTINHLTSGAYNLCVKLSVASTYSVWDIKTAGNSFTDNSANVPALGSKIEIYY